ncbi:MAG: hypothetical protein KQH79_03550 [Bacteroidetes bacterium]|nr:hypothetical protein [Bacteroidota bacterium]
MKKVIFLITILSFFLDAHAQRAKTEKIIILQDHIPQFKLPDHYKIFSNEYISKDQNIELQKDYLLHIDGFTKTHDSESDFIIQFILLNSKTTTKMTRKTTSSSSGKQLGMEGTFEVNAKTNFVCNILSKDSMLIYRLKYPNYEDIREINYESSSLNTNIRSENELKIKARSATETAVKRLLNEVMKETQIQLNKQLGYYKEELEFEIATGKGRKFNYNDLDNALKSFREASIIYSKKGLTENCKNMLNNSIEIWLSALEDYQPNERKVRISDSIIPHIYFNLGVAYYLLENYEEATKYTMMASDIKETNSLINRIKQRQKAAN